MNSKARQIALDILAMHDEKIFEENQISIFWNEKHPCDPVNDTKEKVDEDFNKKRNYPFAYFY